MIYILPSDEKESESVDMPPPPSSRPVRDSLLPDRLEGEECEKDRQCVYGFKCKEGVCFPELIFDEVIDPKEDKQMYHVATGGPYHSDYILHVDRSVIAGKLYVWIGKKVYWFKPRREEGEPKPYEILVPADSEITANLEKTDEYPNPEFRGKLYLTLP